MGPPLSIINDFIYMNIIPPVLEVESNLKQEEDRHIRDYYLRGVISKDRLLSFCQSNIPENADRRMLATWNKKISGILTSYDMDILTYAEIFHPLTRS